MFVPKPLIAGDDLVSQALWSFDSSRLGDDGFVAWLGHHWNVMVDWLSQPREYPSRAMSGNMPISAVKVAS